MGILIAGLVLLIGMGATNIYAAWKQGQRARKFTDKRETHAK